MMPLLAPFKPATVTLDVEDSRIRVLAVRGGKVTRWAVEPLEAGIVRDGVVTDVQALGAHVKAMLASHHIGRGRLIASLTGQRSVPRILTFPQMSAQLLAEAVPREMKRELPVPLEETSLSYQVIGSEDGHLRVFALSVPRDVLKPLVEAIQLSGRKPHALDIKPLALVRAVARAEALIADLEPDSANVIVVRAGIPVTIRTVSIRPEAGGIDDKIQRLREELARTVKFYSDTHRDDPLPPSTPIFLTGSLAAGVASSGVVEASVSHPVEPLAPPLDCPPDLPVAMFMVNIGLALKAT